MAVETSDGKTVTAKYVVLATGCLSMRGCPISTASTGFKGEAYHTGHWPHEAVEFAGKRVGVIGTGSSGIQAVPVIAPQASHLTVFQRTPNAPFRPATGPTARERQAFREQ